MFLVRNQLYVKNVKFMIFTINRVDYNYFEGKHIKVKMQIEETQEFKLNSEIFNTYGYVFHKGNIAGRGHTVALVKINNEWYECDDLKVTKLRNVKLYYEKFVSENISMLFCEKVQ